MFDMHFNPSSRPSDGIVDVHAWQVSWLAGRGTSSPSRFPSGR